MQSARTLIAFILSVAVLFVYYTWISPPLPPPSPTETANPSQKPTSVPDRPPSSLPVALIPQKVESSVADVFFETDEIKAQFSSSTGALKNWILNQFHQGSDPTTPSIDLLNGDTDSLALHLTLGSPSFDSEVKFVQKNSNQKDLLVFKGVQRNLEVTKKITLGKSNEPFTSEVVVEIVNQGEEEVILNPRLWILRPQKKDEGEKGFFSFLKPPPDQLSPILFLNGKLETGERWEKLPEKVEKRGKIYWTGLTDRYFLLGLVARQEGEDISVYYGKDSADRIYTSLSYGDIVLKGGEKVQKRYSAYLGPKKRDELLKMGAYLERSVDYGWFDFVAIPILWLLIFFHKIVANWGVAIIVLTFFIKLLLHPVNVKAMRSMKEMQKIQPEMKGLREKFAGNKEKLNMEMMALFKRHKVNPMGGCLPMLLQMPIYIALYNVLFNAIELYHAPFIWFYKDLSAPDPYLISPIILGVMMALQQKLTPTASVDPAQQKMMTIMPIMFSAFMLFLPSGLVIYILVNTVMSVVQQYLMHRDLSGIDVLKKIFAKFVTTQ